MPPPLLTFFNELAEDDLVELFADGSAADFLVQGGHAMAMALLDLGAERARIVRDLESRGVAVTAWLILDRDDGYWLNADNVAAATRRYAETIAWAEREGLQLHRIGLDIEPPRDAVDALLRRPLPTLWRLLRHRRSRAQIAHAERDYNALVAEIRASGRSVEAYHVPFLEDERLAGTCLLRRTFGILDIDCDLEVPMLYSTYLGEALARSYFPRAPAIALGVTGGGVNAADPREQRRRLSWEALERQLLAAATASEFLYVFSLEGCVWNRLLPCFADIDWRGTESQPGGQVRGALRRRTALRWLLRSEPILDRLLR